MTTSSPVSTSVVDGLTRWQQQLNASVDKAKQAAEEGKWETVSEIMTAITASQAKVSIGLRSKLIRLGLLAAD